jgi:hypothetical protein
MSVVTTEQIGRIEYELADGKRTGRWRPRAGTSIHSPRAQKWRRPAASPDPVEVEKKK